MTELEAEIDHLVGLLRMLGPVRVGAGPRHPSEPDPTLVRAFNRLLAEFLFLTYARGYLEFLARYGGASVAAFDQNLVFDIFGIANCSTNLLDYPVSPLDSDGWFCFANGQFWPHGTGKMLDIVTCAFSFDATGNRQPGVYRQFLFAGRPPPAPIEIRETENECLWPDFPAWLTWLIQNKGVCSDLPSPLKTCPRSHP
jgi:hypothetical protein